ncbi:MAG: DUF3237 domain-containing protein [Gammaproteobacteria bacterium]|nr:DUF3237 domain-containing protein [Gammaproteobacteria bacterium]
MLDFKNPLKTELLFNARFFIDPDTSKWFDVGNGGDGRRLIAPVNKDGGTFEGPRMCGTLQPNFGADWVRFRDDGIGNVDVRCVLHTDDGALIHMYYTGLVYYGVPAPDYPGSTLVHTTPRFETGDHKYRWLNTKICVGVGKTGSNSEQRFLEYSIYALV